MTHFQKTLYFIVVALFNYSAFSQGLKEKKVQQSASNASKSNFIKDGSYLYPTSSFKDQNRFYGDSLSGFTEAAYQADLLSRHFYGGEYFLAMNSLKRDFLSKKYDFTASSNQSNSVSSGRQVGGGGNTVSNAPCVNVDFESTPAGIYNTGYAVSGWTVGSGVNQVSLGVACNGPVNWTLGSPEFSIMTTPIIGTSTLSPFSIDNVTIPNSPLGGTMVARLQDRIFGNMATRLLSTFSVTTSNTLFQFAYAGSWDGSGHQCCDQPSFNVHLYDCVGDTLICYNMDLTPSGPLCSSGVSGYSVTNSISWTNWVVRSMDLTPFIGSCVTIEVINSDCTGGAHHGSAYFDALCGTASGNISYNGGIIFSSPSFCIGSNTLQIAAPPGYLSYQWYTGNPSQPMPTDTNQLLIISNPIAGAIYTVQMASVSGCTFNIVDTLSYSTVSITALATSSTCLGQGIGSATVHCSGSINGYNYAWIGPNGNTNVINTTSVVTNLAAGIYTVNITGAISCGSATATATVISYPQTPTITAVAAKCSNNPPFYLTTTALSGSFTPIVPYLYANGLFIPSYCASGTYIVQYTAVTGSCTAQDTLQISVEAFVAATLTSSLPIQCNTDPVIDLLSLEQYTTGAWSGPGITGTLFNPTAQGVGTYSLTYSTNSSSNVCPVAHSSLVIYVAICTGLQELNTSEPLKIYPNPTNGDLFIEANRPVNITLYNELGAIMLEGYSEGGSYKINLTPFKDGLYFIKAVSKEGQSVMKVVKQE